MGLPWLSGLGVGVEVEVESFYKVVVHDAGYKELADFGTTV